MESKNIEAIKNKTLRLLEDSLGGLKNKSGASLYTGWDSLGKSDMYVMGLNPGADPKTTGKSIIEETQNTQDTWNPYTDEFWAKDGASYSGHQTSVCRVLELVTGTVSPDFFSANAIFARSESEGTLENPWMWWDRCWPLHSFFLSLVRPKLVLCLGNSDSLSAFRLVRTKLTSASPSPYEYLNNQAPIRYRSGKWTRGSIALADGTTLETTVLGVAHPSHFHVPSEFEESIKNIETRQMLGLD